MYTYVVGSPVWIPGHLQRAGSKMTIQDMIAKQTRIERQELPKCQSVSFDGNAANVFQACVSCR